MSAPLTYPAPHPVCGRYTAGFAPVAQRFAEHFTRGEEIGAALAVYHRGEQVVDLWGGLADVKKGRRWQRHTRIVLFSVTKGFAAMAMNMLADRGAFDWDAPVEEVWPGFATNGKQRITIRMLLNHRAGLPYLDNKLSLHDCTDKSRRGKVLAALEAQSPIWCPGGQQGYHATTFGLYVQELFRRIAGENIEDFLLREVFNKVGSDVRLGTPAAEDHQCARLYPPHHVMRVKNMLTAMVTQPNGVEARVARAMLARRSVARRAFLNPSTGPAGVAAYNQPFVRRAALAWASATGSANGVARAYLPFANGGTCGDEVLVRESALRAVYARQSWAQRDQVLQKPLGWSQGFLKEQRHLFCPNAESFGHAGLGGALGWCDPVANVAFGYTLNRMGWRVRSPRAVGLCRALYECEPLR